MRSMRCEGTTVKPKVAIVDYGLGNLFSIKHACIHAGLEPSVTSCGKEITEAEAVILPGVGAFGDAVAALRRLDLTGPIREVVESGTPLVGICLGMQLLMSESFEFGLHKGLGIVEGVVQKLGSGNDSFTPLKVPHVGWNRIYRRRGEGDCIVGDPWDASPLRGVGDGEHMYFVHSYHIIPADPSVVLSITRYGDTPFCSSLERGSIFATQFHPERSGPLGLKVYLNIKELLDARGKEREVFA